MKRINIMRKLWLPALLLITGTALIYPMAASSAVLLDRSVRLLDPNPSATTSHTFAFNIQSNNNVGSIVFEYCTNNPLFTSPCTPPVGLNVTGASLTSQAGETGFSVNGAVTTLNRLVIGRPPSVTAMGPAQYALGNIVNPSTNRQTVYVKISLHNSSDGTGSRTDEGAVVFKILTGIDTRAYVPPHLTFCTGITVAINCSSASGFYIDLGELSKVSPKTGTSQYSASTNDFNGYVVAIHGITMTAGNETIPALNSPSFSSPGTSQFGINLRNNSNPNVGSDKISQGTANASSDYGLINRFKFRSGDTLSSVNTSSDFDKFTVSYLVNVAPDQAPGIYNATFNYIATAAF